MAAALSELPRELPRRHARLAGRSPSRAEQSRTRQGASGALALDAAHILTVHGGKAVRLVSYQSGRKPQRTPGSPSLDEQVSIDQTKAGAEMDVNRSEVNAAAEGVRWTEVLRGAGRGPVGTMAMTGMRW